MDKLLILLVFLAMTPLSASGLVRDQAEPINRLTITKADRSVYVADARKKRKSSRPASRELNVIREAKLKKDRKNIDFEAANLYGQRKLPMGSMIGQGKADKSFDLIRIRSNWNPEMIQSTSSLELGN